MNTPSIKQLKKIKISPEVKMVAFECFLFAAGFFLTPIKFIFGTYPFGLALVAACGKYTPFAFAGAILSVAFKMNGDPVYLIAFGALMGLRIIGSLWIGADKPAKRMLGEEKKNNIISSLFCENTSVRVAICSLCALGVGAYRVVAGGYLYYDIFVLLFFTVFAGIMAYCFHGALEGGKNRSFIFALTSFSFCAVYALSGKEIQGIDIAIIFSYALTLYISRYMSGAKGAAVGTVLGVVQNVSFAPVYAIAATVSGFLWATSPYLAIMSAFVLSVGYGIFVSGYEAVVYLVPELLGASLIMYPLLKFEMIPRPAFLKKDTAEAKSMEAFAAEKKIDDVKVKISSLSTSFKDISEMFGEVSEKIKNPSRASIENMCLEECEKYCSSCPKEKICWEKDINTTEDNISKMGGAVYENGNVSHTDIDEKFLHRCPNIDKIFERVNSKNISVHTDFLRNNKLEVSARDYDLISQMLSCVYSSVEDESVADPQMSEKVSRASSKIGFVCDKIEVWGKRKKKVIATGVDTERTKCTVREFTDALEKVMGTKLSEPTIEDDNGYATLVCESEKKFDIKSSWLSSVTDNEEVNGDTVSSFDGASDKHYMLVCDGMGSGTEAQMTSSMCALFLEKILSATSEKEVALSMLNNFIRAKNLECSSSVDLMEIDLITGKGTFVKSGAAPSFIKRGDNVFKLHSKTAPIGIMKNIDAEQLGFEVRRGDVLVMVSDGIVSSSEESDWLVSLITSFNGDDIDALPERIIKEAKERNLRKDDMSVCAVLIA